MSNEKNTSDNNQGHAPLAGVSTSAFQKGDKVKTPMNGMVGAITRITKKGVAWVKIKSRWGNHHHPVTAKTYKFELEALEHWC